MTVRKAKIAAISCSHAPFTPPETERWILDTLANVEGLTHFGHLGDVFEGAAASVHANEYSHTLSDEFDAAASFLKNIRSVLPHDCKKWINTGNHDDNIMVSDPRRIPKSLRSMVHWSNHPEFSEEAGNWQWLPYSKDKRAIYRVGQVHFWHGFDAGGNSDELEGLQMIAHSGWIPHSLAVRGHTHRPVPPTQAKRTARIPLPYYYANVGTCGPLSPDWAARKDRSQWGAAIIVVEAKWDKPSHLSGKCWDAELIRMKP